MCYSALKKKLKHGKPKENTQGKTHLVGLSSPFRFLREEKTCLPRTLLFFKKKNRKEVDSKGEGKTQHQMRFPINNIILEIF